MFEDDSTQSFEDLERRLKTPGKTKPVSKLIKTPKHAPKVVIQSPTPIIKEVTATLPPPQKKEKEIVINEVIKTPTRTNDKDIEKETVECDFVGKLFKSRRLNHARYSIITFPGAIFVL